MLRTVFKAFILLTWLGSAAWLIRYEAFPHRFNQTVQGYRELSEHLPAMRDTWMKVHANGDHVGYINSGIEMKEVEGLEELFLTTKLTLNVLFQGQVQPVRIQNEVRLNARHELLGSESSFFLSGISGSLTLEPLEKKGEYQIDIEVRDVKFSRKLSIPDEAILSSPFFDQMLGSVKPGQTLRIRALDPLSMSGELQTIELRGISKETKYLPRLDQTLEVTRVETHIGDLVLESEVDEYGRMLWQDTPFGLTFLMSTANEAVQIPDGNGLDPSKLLFSPVLQTYLPEMNLP